MDVLRTLPEVLYETLRDIAHDGGFLLPGDISSDDLDIDVWHSGSVDIYLANTRKHSPGVAGAQWLKDDLFYYNSFTPDVAISLLQRPLLH